LSDTSIPDVYAALAAWDTPALSNAIGRLAVRPRNTGHSDGTVRRVAGQRLCGVAVTATLRSRDQGDDGVPIRELYRALGTAVGPPVVVVQDLDDPPGAGALLGEVTGNIFRALGVAGYVTDGRVRDEAELAELGLAVFAAGLCVSSSYVRVTAVNVPVRVAGLDVAPGDLLHGDQHGLLSVPRDVAGQIPQVAEQIRVEEQQTVTWTRSEAFSLEALLARGQVRH
jgi:4-hydroxy-4-methyl-2-oxoglutarate aldolase